MTNFSGVSALAINSSGHIFVGTDRGVVFRSTNNGDSWAAIHIGLTITNTTIRSLAINSSGHIFAGTFSKGVFRSTNNGDNWMAVNSGLTNIDIRSFAINSSGHIFAGTGGGIFRSTDNGMSWSQINTGLTNTDVYALAISPGNGHIFAGTYGSGVFRSCDNGESWSITGLTNTNVLTLVINSNGHILAGTNNGVFHSTDNGANWSPINSGLINTNVNALAIGRDGHIFAGTNGSAFRSAKPITTTGEEISSSIPALFSLEQNYPNPFNPSTTIQFNLAKRMTVNLKVFDVSGREVATLVDETLGPCTYKVVFEANSLPGGVYFYRLEAGEFMQTKKLVAIK
ncbi:MAG: T9SS type A sorting domain-containing protein [bacterium]